MSLRPPIFLERRGYRLRRVRDAARLLPIVGIFVIMLPLLWGGGMTRGGVIYLFVVWLFLIILAAIVDMFLRRFDDDTTTPSAETD